MLWPVGLLPWTGCTAWLNGTGVLALAPRDTLDEGGLDGHALPLRRANVLTRLPLAAMGAIECDRCRNLVMLAPRVSCVLGHRLRFRTRRGNARDTRKELRARLRETAAASAA